MAFLRERLGAAVGAAMAPAVRMISAARQARTFHPDGLVFRARVKGASGSVGERLDGFALVRCSGALWRRGPQWPDVLGVAIRFRATDDVSPLVLPGDQDLLFATIVSPLTMGSSPFTTDVRDFARNHFWAVSPFDVEGVGRAKFRLSPVAGVAQGSGNREARLREAVGRGQVGFSLELRRTWHLGWQPVARIMLEQEVQVDQGRLHFSAFNDGRQFEPRGFVHAMRRAVYSASQAGRPTTQ